MQVQLWLAKDREWQCTCCQAETVEKAQLRLAKAREYHLLLVKLKLRTIAAEQQGAYTA